MQLGTLLSILPLLGWGTGDYFASLASRRFKLFTLNFVFSVYNFPLPVILCLVKGFPTLSVGLVAGMFLASLFVTAGFLCMVRGFSQGSVGLVAPLANAYAVVTLFVAVLLFGEVVHMRQLLAIAIIIGSIVAVSYQPDPQHKKRTWFSVKYGVLGMILFGCGFALSGHYSLQTTWYGGQLIMTVAAFVYATLLLLVRNKPDEKQQIAAGLRSKVVMGGGIIGTVGALGFFAAIAYDVGLVTVAAVASAAPLLTAYYAHVFDHESLGLKQRIATIVIVASVMYLNLAG